MKLVFHLLCRDFLVGRVKTKSPGHQKVRESMEVFNSYFWPTDFLIGNRCTLQTEQLELLPVFSSVAIPLP